MTLYIVQAEISGAEERLVVNADSAKDAAQILADYFKIEDMSSFDSFIDVYTLLIPEKGQRINWDTLDRNCINFADLRYPDDFDVVGEGDE